MAFTNEQMERYSRHIILQEVGVKGQKKLLNGKVLIIGAGGLGAPAAMYLAAAGVGTIGIVDADEVDLSNLQRQIIHGTADVGKAKVKSAKETMNAMNSDVVVNTYREFVTSENIMDLIADYDFIIDGTDNFPAKFLINDACVMAKKPFSHAGIIRFKGQLMTYVPGEGPCYRCVFKDPPPKDAVPTCKQAGVIGAMGGVIGSLQAMEAIKYLIGVGDLLTGKLLTYDALKMEFHTIKLPKDFNVENSDVVVDVGVAEGNFSLDIIDRVKKIYLIETDDDWLEALKMTFREYEDKVQIVKGYVSSVEEGPFVTLDSIISEPVNFIKMDIEGNEWDALQGAAKLIQKSENIRCAICSYHSDFDQTLIEAFFDGMDIKHNTSDGYMWFPWKVRQNYVSTRLNRALVRGEK